MIQKLAENIVAIIKDYHSYRDFQFTTDHIIKWVNQFDENDREFILSEFLHLLKQNIYVSEEKARQLLIGRIEQLSKVYKFANPVAFLGNAEFLRLQPKDKSQDVLLKLLDEELHKKYGIGLTQCGAVTKKYTIYLDDVQATGGTVFNDCLKWLQNKDENDESNLDKVIKQEKIFIVSLFCLHNWNNVEWRLKLSLKNDKVLKKIKWYYDYEIQNHPKFLNQRLNFAYPKNDQSSIVQEYLDELDDAITNEESAFRKEELPVKETFFSSPAARTRLEMIFLLQGIEILTKTKNLKPNHRPMGAGFPSYKTLGTGTIFFTWRNVPNTSPIVFWWKADHWQPLFPLYKRGLAE